MVCMNSLSRHAALSELVCLGQTLRMASRKRKAIASRTQEPYDTTRFTFEGAWEQLIRRNWHKALTQFMDRHIDVALVKEFYLNLGRLIKLDATSLNAFLEMPPIIRPGEQYPSYALFYRARTDPHELASKLCIPRREFVLNAKGAPWKLLRKDLMTLAQTWSVLSYSNLAPTSHTSNLAYLEALRMELMQKREKLEGVAAGVSLSLANVLSKYHPLSETSARLASKINLEGNLPCKHEPSATPGSLSQRSLTHAKRENGAKCAFEDKMPFLKPEGRNIYIKKNNWNLDDPTIVFPGTRKARAQGSEGPSSFATPAPASSAPAPPPAPAPAPSTSASPVPSVLAPAPFASSSSLQCRCSEVTVPMLQSIHRGLCLVMQSMHDSTQHRPIISMEEFTSQPRSLNYSRRYLMRPLQKLLHRPHQSLHRFWKSLGRRMALLITWDSWPVTNPETPQDAPSSPHGEPAPAQDKQTPAQEKLAAGVSLSKACALSENHALSEALSLLSELGEFGGESEKHLRAQRIISLLSKAFVSSPAKCA
ncbi:hypothetical protein HKD37_12G034275 [Glycine soja]